MKKVFPRTPEMIDVSGRKNSNLTLSDTSWAVLKAVYYEHNLPQGQALDYLIEKYVMEEDVFCLGLCAIEEIKKRKPR